MNAIDTQMHDNCERSELLIWQVYQFGLGCIIWPRRKDIKFTRNGVLIGHCAQFFIQPTFENTGYKGVLVHALNLHRNRKTQARTGETWKIP